MSGWAFFLYGLIPLIVFVLLDLFANIKWAVAGAIACAIVDVFLTRYWFGFWDPGTIVAAVLFMALGYVTLKWHNPVFIKLQPSVLGLFLAAVVAYYQFFSVPLVTRYLPQIKEMAPELAHNFDNPVFVTRYNDAVTGMVFVLLLHAAWMAYAAFRQSNTAWLAVRAVGFWVLFAIYAVGVGVFVGVSAA